MKRTIILFALVLMVAGTATATSHTNLNPGAMPGDLTYIFDQLGEQAQIAAASAPVFGSSTDLAQVRANIAQERLAEANVLVERNASDGRVSNLVNDYRENINKAKTAANNSNKTEVMEKVQNMTQKNVEVLQGLKSKLPEQAQYGINTAIAASSDVMVNMKKGIKNKPEMVPTGKPSGTPIP